LKKGIKKLLLPPLSKLPRLADGFGQKGLALQKHLLLIHPKKVGSPVSQFFVLGIQLFKRSAIAFNFF